MEQSNELEVRIAVWPPYVRDIWLIAMFAPPVFLMRMKSPDVTTVGLQLDTVIPPLPVSAASKWDKGAEMAGPLALPKSPKTKPAIASPAMRVIPIRMTVASIGVIPGLLQRRRLESNSKALAKAGIYPFGGYVSS